MDATTKPSKKICCAFDGCKKRMGLTDFVCRCEKFYCALHRSDVVHNCPYDYKATAKQELLKYMSTPIVAAKLEIV
jgi:hypothetical protein